MYRNKTKFPFHCRRSIYFSLVYSRLVYGIEVYGNSLQSYLDPLIKKCNKLLRILQNKNRRSNAPDLYSDYNTIPVNLLHNLFTMKLIHRMLI